MRQRRIDHLQLNELVAAHIAEIVVSSKDIHEATEFVAELLDVDPMTVPGHLLNFSLFGLTRASRAAQTEQLHRLRDQQ
jgi:hypothetical protein